MGANTTLNKQPRPEPVLIVFLLLEKCDKRKIQYRVISVVKCIVTITLSISHMPRHFSFSYIVITGVKHSIWHCCAHLIFLLIEHAY